MGLLNFFKQKQSQVIAPQISENTFVDNSEPQEQSTMRPANRIDEVYTFLNVDYDPKGYSDAFKNSDASNLSAGIEVLKLELRSLLGRVKYFYECQILDFDTHINSRRGAGLNDLANELINEKSKAEKCIAILDEISNDNDNGINEARRIILSYTTGFRRGLTAITNLTILK